MLVGIATVLLLFWAAGLPFVVAGVVAGRAAGISIDRVDLGWGPRVAGWRWGGTAIDVRALPGGGGVKFHDPQTEEERDPDRVSFSSRPFAVRVVVVLIGVAAQVLVAVLLIGGDGFSRAFLSLFEQLLVPFVDQSAAVGLLTGWYDLALDDPLGALGVLSAKLVALNVLPLIGLGNVWTVIVGQSGKLGDAALDRIGCVSMIVVLALAGAWLTAVVRAIF